MSAAAIGIGRSGQSRDTGSGAASCEGDLLVEVFHVVGGGSGGSGLRTEAVFSSVSRMHGRQVFAEKR
jgi:hypothetical protein